MNVHTRGQTSWMPGPMQVYRRLFGRRRQPPPGNVRFGDLRRVRPVSREFGFDRGQPIDRYYIERFLDQHRSLVRGRVLEVGDDAYTLKYGGEKVVQSDVLHVDDSNPYATFVGDLASADHIPSDCFDTIILTQTLHLVYDMPAAVRTLHRILSPSGTLLLTVPGITQTSTDEWEETWYWALTRRSAQRLFEAAFPESHVHIGTFGNVLAATAFLQGLSAGELTARELDFPDPHYQLIVAVRATKPDAESGSS